MPEMETQANDAQTNGIGHNQLTDLSALKKAIQNIEKKMSKLESMKGAYMQECKGVREEITSLYQAAKDKGIQKRALKTLIATREMQRRIDAKIAELDDEITEEYNAYCDAVTQWELPL